MPLAADQLLAFCQQHHDWLVHTIESLVRLESPSDDKRALDTCALALVEQMTALGWRAAMLVQPTAGNHVRGEVGTGERQVLLLGHFDTVWPVGQLARMPLEVRDGRLHGPGVYDMKSGIATAWLAVRALRTLAPAFATRVVLLLTSDEETGSASSRAIVEEEADRSDAVLVLEPCLPGGAVKTARKGIGEYRVEVHGVAAHAGIEPGTGASAIVELAQCVLELRQLQDLERGTTVNVGRIGGGSRPNVVADLAWAEVDVRVPTVAAAEHVSRAMAALAPHSPRVSLSVTGGINRPPLERTPAVERIYRMAHEAARELGMDLGEGASGGGSDGNFTAARGVPTLDGLGPEGAGAHAIHEHVLLAPLARRSALLAGLLHRLT